MSGHASSHRSHCQNCGAPLSGPYCSVCGQHDVDYHRSIWPMAEDALEGFLHLDGKFFKSVRYMFTRPGFLTREFIAGRRTAYANPLRFYIFASFLFFAADTLLTHRQTPAEEAAAKEQAARNVKEAQEQIRNVEAQSPAVKKAIDALKAKGVVVGAAGRPGGIAVTANNDGQPEGRIGRMIRANLGPDGKLDTKAVGKEFAHLFPPMLFFCLPFLAAVLKLVYWRTGRFYVEHLVFALHLQAFVFLVALGNDLINALGRLAGTGVSDWLAFLLLVGALWMIFRSFRRVYGQGRAKTALKLALVAAMYGLTLTFGIVMIAVASAYLVSLGS